MTRYRLMVDYQVGRYRDGWYWLLHEIDENGRIVGSESAYELYSFRWTAILGGRLAARERERDVKYKAPYTKEFTI